MRRRVALLLAASSLVVGCGTTVHTSGPGANAAGDSDAVTSAPALTAPSGAPTPTASTGTAGTVAGPSVPGVAGPAGAVAPPTGPVIGPNGAVKIGFFLTDDASQIYKTLGISGASHTRAESRAIWQSVIDEVNKRGGLAGHHIVARYAWIDSESGSNATRAQAACDYFVHDEKVFAVVVDGAGDLSLPRCLAQYRIPAIDIGQTSYPYDDTDLAALSPYLYLPGRLSMSRFGTYIDMLAAHGFFATNSKVGLLRLDLPDQQRVRSDVIEPALKRHGLALTSDFAFTPIESTKDLPRAANEANAAVLQMRGSGVDRVLFLGSGLALPYVFPTVAESQGYRPRYGITTDDGPDFMATNAPAAQMTGAMAVGWEPQYDVADSKAVLRADPLWRRCAAVMRAAGFTARDGRRCTGLYFLEQALQRSSVLSAAALRTGADDLGPTPYSTQTYATYYGPHRYDGVSAVRTLRFQPSCTCFRYLTGNVPVER